MPGCSAVGCKNRSERKLPGISFHRFPKESVFRAAWIVACRRRDWLPSATSVLCSEHFSEDLIDRTSLTNVRLRENAIPNIFKVPSKKSNLQKDSEKHKFPKKHLTSTPVTAFLSDEETQSSDEKTSETTKECGVIKTAVCSNSPENGSSVEYELPVSIPENHKSPEKRLAFKAAVAFVKEVIQSSDESTSEIPTIYNVMKPTISLNSPVNESSIENRPPMQIPKKHKFPEKHLSVTAGTAFSDSEVIESGDESVSETSTEYNMMEPLVCLNSTVNESDVEIPVEESDSELYPTQDIETINLKRKLAEANNLISKYRKKIKILQQQNRRWKKRLENAKRSLSILQKTNKTVFL